MKKNILGILSVILVCLYPCLFMYFRNAGESSFSDITTVALLFVGTGIVLMVIYTIIFRKLSKAITLTNVTMLIICNFELFVGLMENKQWLHKDVMVLIAAAILLDILGHILYKKSEDFSYTANLLFFIVFGGLILVNGIPAIPTITEKMSVTVEKENDILASLNANSVNVKKAPNIYCMIFDEYAGPENLKHYYNFDNEDFVYNMEQLNFNRSVGSYTQESIDTWTCIPNLLNLNYVVSDDMTQAGRLEYMDAYIYDVVDYLGYDINTVSFPEFLYEERSNESFSGNNLFENTAGYFVLENSIFLRPYLKYQDYKTTGTNKTELNYGEKMVSAMNCFKGFTELSKESKPQFNLAYFSAPHIGFYYTEDGRINTLEEQVNWENHSYYLGYMKWTNHRIEEMVSEIITKDPESIIIILSDHGARYVKHGGEMGYDVEGLDPKYEKNILNMVYYKGEEFDIEGLSGINTLRKILNEQFGANLEMLEWSGRLENN